MTKRFHALAREGDDPETRMYQAPDGEFVQFEDFERYRIALQRANGYLIGFGHEPVKLEYSSSIKEGK